MAAIWRAVPGAGGGLPLGLGARERGRRGSSGTTRRKTGDLLVQEMGLSSTLGPRGAAGPGQSADPEPGTAGCSSYLQFEAAGERVACAAADCKVRVFDVASGRLEGSVGGHSELVTSVCWLGPGSPAAGRGFFTSSLDKTVRLWLDYRPAGAWRDHGDWIRCMALAPAGETLLSGCVSSRVFGWDAATGRVKFRLALKGASKGGTGGAGAGAPPGARLCNSTFDNSVNSLCFSPGSPNLFVSGVREGTVCFWDARCLGQGPTASVQAHDWKLNRVELARGGTLLATSGRDGALRMWDARKLGPAGLGRTRGEGRPGAKRGHGGAAKREILWEGRSHSCRSYNVGCTFLNGDHSVATGSEDGAVWVYDTDTGRPRRALTGHTSVVHCVSAPPAASGRMVLASCSIDSSNINVWTPVRGAPQAAPGTGGTGARRDVEGAASVQGASVNPLPAPRGGAPLTRLRARELAAAPAPCNVGAGGGIVPMEMDRVESGGGDGRSSPERAATASGGAEVRRAASIGLRTETREEAMQRAQRAAIETLMHQHGDLMLRIFHTYDYSFRAAFNWQALLEHIRGVCEARGLPHEGPGAAASGEAGGAVDETDPVAVINAVHSMAQDFAAALRQQQESILADEPTLPAPLGLQETPPGGMRVPRPPRRHSS